MIIKDNVYGKIKIEEPVLLELLKSPSILRLKKISQYGIPDKYYHFRNFSRYEHSIGVLILLRKLRAPLEEQVAGLIHDISHLTFSHVADWVFSKGSEGNEDLQNSLMKKFIEQSGITRMLTKYGFLLDRLLNEDNFSLLEKKIPDLCADRIDYSLREFKYWLNPKIVKECTKNLVNFNGEIVFSNQKTAFEFAVSFLDLQTIHWGGREAMSRYYLFSSVLKVALVKRVIKKSDFYKDEDYILEKIENSREKEIRKILSLLSKKSLMNIKGKSGKKIFKKFRYVDPKIIINGNLVRLSQINPKFQKILNKHRKINKKGLTV